MNGMSHRITLLDMKMFTQLVCSETNDYINHYTKLYDFFYELVPSQTHAFRRMTIFPVFLCESHHSERRNNRQLNSYRTWLAFRLLVDAMHQMYTTDSSIKRKSGSILWTNYAVSYESNFFVIVVTTAIQSRWWNKFDNVNVRTNR